MNARTAYRTGQGTQMVGNSLNLLEGIESESVDLIVTSPPFALVLEKEYGNESQTDYVDWLALFGKAAHRVLKDTGSLVIDLGGTYQPGIPARSLYNFEVVVHFCDRLGYHLAQDFYWHNPAKLPTPIEWVNVRKIRVKDTVNTIWWLSRSPHPKSDTRRVHLGTAERLTVMAAAETTSDEEHWSIPHNLLQIANTESNSTYLRRCRELGRKPHPARFPKAVPAFFIRLLTEPGDLVVDIFSGSNTTGEAAEELDRHWISMELDAEYAATSVLRFLGNCDAAEAAETLRKIDGKQTVEILQTQPGLLGAAGCHPPARSGID